MDKSAPQHSPAAPRICYVHIPKSAGTYLRTVLQSGYAAKDVCHFLFQGDFIRAEKADYLDKRLFSAHIGYDLAATLNAELITVLRNPFDRVLSLYYYWKEVEGAPPQVKSMGLEAFLESEDPVITENLHNVQAWQLAFGHMHSIRCRHRDVSDDELLNRAIANLENFSVVGLYEQLDWVTQQIEERYGIKAPLAQGRVNATAARPPLNQTSVRTLERIYARNSVDVALYDHVARRAMKRCSNELARYRSQLAATP